MRDHTKLKAFEFPISEAKDTRLVSHGPPLSSPRAKNPGLFVF